MAFEAPCIRLYCQHLIVNIIIYHGDPKVKNWKPFVLSFYDSTDCSKIVDNVSQIILWPQLAAMISSQIRYIFDTFGEEQAICNFNIRINHPLKFRAK